VSSERSESSGDVSVIIPAYQAESTIARALDSVLAQTVLPAEVIVIDDGSRDRTREIVNAYVRRETPCAFHLIEQKNLGAGAARNRGLLASDSRLVAFLDADDEWLPEKLSRSLATMKTFSADLVSHDYLRADGESSSYIECARNFNRRPDPFVDYFLRGYIATSTVVASRQLLLDAGGFDPSLRAGQDYELWLAAISRPDMRHHVFAEALTRYHVTPNSITSQVEQRRRAAVRILYRHLPALREHSRFPRSVGIMRAAIICLQAAQAYRSARNSGGSFRAIFRLPIHVVLIMASAMNVAVDRPDFLTGEEATE
jgi:glycosyltransferase involved in cell wall biosynthesis